MKSIRYQCLGKTYSPFSDTKFEQRLEAYGFRCGSKRGADLVFVRNLRHAKIATRLFPWRKVVVWSHEPSYDYTPKKSVSAWPGHQIEVFNVFTGNVFWHNPHFIGSYHYDDTIDLGLRAPPESLIIPSRAEWSKRKLAIAVYARKPDKACHAQVGGKPVGLSYYRQELAKTGHSLGICDIAGAGWEGRSIESSGFTGTDECLPWWSRKIELLYQYRFNLAFENTNWPYYVTEKIWQSICGCCLPIYWGRGNSIYESFPDDSFVDAASFDSRQALWDYLSTMEYDEWRRRLMRCIEAYRKEFEKCQSLGFPHFEETIQRFKNVLYPN